MYCQIRQYRLAIWPIPVGNLVNTGWRFGQYQWRYIFQDLGRFEVESGDSKNIGGLRIMPRYGIKNKRKSIWLQKCPFNFLGSLSIGQIFCMESSWPQALVSNIKWPLTDLLTFPGIQGCMYKSFGFYLNSRGGYHCSGGYHCFQEKIDKPISISLNITQ